MRSASDGKARVSLEEDSGAQGALVAIDNATGEIKAMVGGRDFNLSKFNRATQALRQVGSSFKPYVYTAAIDRGATPDDTILDAPVTFPTALRSCIRPTTTTKTLRVPSPFGVRWPSPATFPR